MIELKIISVACAALVSIGAKDVIMWLWRKAR